jgi:ubiquinone biosynthesis protein
MAPYVNTDQTINLVLLIKTCMSRKFTNHPERYVEILHILQKYKLYHLLSQLGPLQQPESETYAPDTHQAHEAYAEDLTCALEELGPCFIKFGQVMSTRPDMLPLPYVQALSRLQNTVKPVPTDKIMEIIEYELGASHTKLFRCIDHEPLATASIAQVHKAVLHNGSQVVIKVQRPGIQQQVETDMEVMQEVAHFLTKYTPFGLRYGLLQIVQELKQSLSQELDFQQEADNTYLVGLILRDFPCLTTPTVYREYISRRVLILSFVHGRSLTLIPSEELKHIDTSTIAQNLFAAYLKQMTINGIFHCDPHPGNILLTYDGHLALLDFGMVGHFDNNQKENVILLMLAFSEGRGERVADTYLRMVEAPEEFDSQAFAQEISALVNRYHDMDHRHMDIGRALLDIVALARSYHTPIPANFTLLGKAMLNLDGTLRTLSPDFNPIPVIRHYMRQVMQQQALDQVSLIRSYNWLLDAKHLTENMPYQADLISDKLAHDRLTIRLKIERLDKTFQQATRRLSLSMIVSSAMIGASLLLSSRHHRD